ncbi:MAG: ribonuclease H family protein [Bacteroides sp.]|jgi:ribonuclease HI|nr:ribonuclease H family protein [Bacteroides sp.]
MPKKKYYVVWAGHQTGVFDNWNECRKAVHGFEGARYKSFETLEQAKKAYQDNPFQHIGKKAAPSPPDPEKIKAVGMPIENSLSVDAACNMTTGDMEYRGVYTASKTLLFKQGPFPKASNNIGEFLALVHALAWCQKNKLKLPIYSDSKTAMAWVRNKHAKTKVEENSQNEALFDLIDRAEYWLKNNNWENPILKWETEVWGEIPADYGRK